MMILEDIARWFINDCGIHPAYVTHTTEPKPTININCSMSLPNSSAVWVPNDVIVNVNGLLACSGRVKSLTGLQNYSAHEFICDSMHVTNFEDIPTADSITLSGTGIRNLSAVLPHLKSDVACLAISSTASLRSFEGISDIKIPFNIDTFAFSCAFIERGGIGLILIPGIKRIRFGTMIKSRRNLYSDDVIMSNKPNAFDAFYIIQKYIGRPEDIFECQMELIDEGLSEFAVL